MADHLQPVKWEIKLINITCDFAMLSMINWRIIFHICKVALCGNTDVNEKATQNYT